MDYEPKLPPPSDPWHQDGLIRAPNGSPIPLSIDYLDRTRLVTARLGLTYGSQIGASIMLLLVLLLLTRAEKRKSSIFITNMLCLVVNTIRCILLGMYLTSGIWHPYTQLVGDFSRVTRGEYAANITANIFSILLAILAMVSLSLQTWVVCVTTMPMQRHLIMIVTTLAASTAIVARAIYQVCSIIQCLKWESMEKYLWTQKFNYISQAVAICCFSIVFTWKLGYAILQRRRLNMPQFGPMQVIFIMGCQTMIVPAIFSTLQFRSELAETGTAVLTLVSIFLPLSAIWAGVISETIPASSGPNAHRKLIMSDFQRESTKSASISNATTVRSMSVCTCGSSKSEMKPYELGTSPASRKNVSDFEGIGYGDQDILVESKWEVTIQDADDRV